LFSLCRGELKLELHEGRGRKKGDTSKKIIGVALDLFRKQGFDATSMEQIAEEAGIARMTLYNHFPAKEAIINSYVQRKIHETMPTTIQLLQGLPDTRSRLTAVLTRQWEWAKKNLPMEILEKFYIFLMQTALDSFKNPDYSNSFADILAYCVKLGQKQGEIRQDVVTEDVAIMLSWIHGNTIMRWIADPEHYPVHERINRSVDLFMRGVVSRSNQEK
jgi:AcrR family transcriptional regulator